MHNTILGLISALTLALAPTLVPTNGTSAASPKEAHSQTGSKALTLTSALSHGAILEGDTREVFLHLSLHGGKAAPTKRPRLNLALVIDRSGSMASDRKLEFAKSAALQLAGRLADDDRLSIVTYDNKVQVAVPTQPASHRSVFRAAIEAIQTGGSTNLYGGMMEGFHQVLSGEGEGSLNRVILLSDGLANKGPKDPLEVGGQAASCRNRGVRISTMGMGLSYDELLLQAIARESGGNYFYVADPESVGDFIAKELDGMGRVVARDPVVRLQLAPGVEVAEVFGYSFTQRGRQLEIPVADILSGEERKIMLRLCIPARGKASRPVSHASLRYIAQANGEAHTQADSPLSVRVTGDPALVASLRNTGVLAKAEVSLNGQALVEATRMQKAARLEAAIELLDARIADSTKLNASLLNSEEVTRTLKRMGAVRSELERTRLDPAAARDVQLDGELAGLGYL